MKRTFVLLAAAGALALMALLLLSQPEPAERDEPTPARSEAGSSSGELVGRGVPEKDELEPPTGAPKESSASRASGAQATETPPGFTEALRGRVLGPNGEGVPGVELSIHVIPPRNPNRHTKAPRGGLPLNPRRSSAVVSHAEGRFKLLDVNLDGGVVLIGFRKVPPGFVVAKPLRIPLSSEEIVLHLEADRPITGRVVFGRYADPEMRALVYAHWIEGGEHRATRHLAAADGRFTVHHLPAGTEVDLMATRVPAPTAQPRRLIFLAKGGRSFSYGGPEGVLLGVEAGTRDVEIHLEEHARTSLQAVDSEGRPLVSQAFQVTPTHGGPWGGGYAYASPTGEVRLGALPAGSYLLVPIGRRGKTLAPVELRLPTQSAQVAFSPRASRRVPGRLVGAGRIDAFRVIVQAEGDDETQVVMAGSDGRFEVELEVGKRYDVRAERFGDTRCGFLRGVDATAEEIEIALEPGLSLSGRVLDVDGEPTNFETSITASNDRVHARQALLPGGRFTFHGLPRGRYTVRVGHATLGITAVAREVEAGTTDLVLRLSTGR